MTTSGQLLPRHTALLVASAISDEVAAARGYRSVEHKARLTKLGFSSPQARVPALLIPIWNVYGEIGLHQTRADEPRIVDHSKAVKYETPLRSRMVLDVPPTLRGDLGRPGCSAVCDRGCPQGRRGRLRRAVLRRCHRRVELERYERARRHDRAL